MRSSKIRGFTLVELLCIIVILGICITASIVAVTRVIDTAKKDETVVQEKLLVKTCETYIQDHKEDAPKVEGQATYVYAKKLGDTKYLKEDIVDYNGNSCMKYSYVRIYKLSDTELIYTPYLYCGKEKADDVEYIYEPTVNMYFIGNNNDNKIFDDLENAYIYMDITGGTTKGGSPIAINKYSYTISVKDVHGNEIETYESDKIDADKKNNLNIKEKLIKYVSLDSATYISVSVRVSNVIGGVKEVNTTAQYNEK